MPRLSLATGNNLFHSGLHIRSILRRTRVNNGESLFGSTLLHPILTNYYPISKKGCSVFIEGNISLRVYSSKVDRCMKAGISVHADTIQLLGGSVDAQESC